MCLPTEGGNRTLFQPMAGIAGSAEERGYFAGAPFHGTYGFALAALQPHLPETETQFAHFRTTLALSITLNLHRSCVSEQHTTLED